MKGTPAAETGTVTLNFRTALRAALAFKFALLFVRYIDWGDQWEVVPKRRHPNLCDWRLLWCRWGSWGGFFCLWLFLIRRRRAWTTLEPWILLSGTLFWQLQCNCNLGLFPGAFSSFPLTMLPLYHHLPRVRAEIQVALAISLQTHRLHHQSLIDRFCRWYHMLHFWRKKMWRRLLHWWS